MILKTYKNFNSKIRNKLMDEVNTKYDRSISGVNAILSALSDFRDYVIVLFDGKKILGAVSYYLSKKELH